MKDLVFRGSARSELMAFPSLAIAEAGYQLHLVQIGQEPDDWKPMQEIGPGVREIRVRDDAGAFRIVYVARFADAVYVLHCFQKKTQQTAQSKIELARKRYKELVSEKRI